MKAFFPNIQTPVLLFCAILSTVKSAEEYRQADNSPPESDYEIGKRLYDFGLGKRAYRYVSEYKRLPMYDFGLGKRAKTYSFGLGKRSENEYDTYDEDNEQIPEIDVYDDDTMQAADKRAPMYSFGLGKRPLYQFGLGKRARNYDFGLGKRAKSYSFGLGKRGGKNMYSFGLGKRNDEPSTLDKREIGAKELKAVAHETEEVLDLENATSIIVDSHEEMGHGGLTKSF